MSTVSQ